MKIHQCKWVKYEPIAGIYSSTTVDQIKSGKHVYWSFEGYLTLYVPLHKNDWHKFSNQVKK